MDRMMRIYPASQHRLIVVVLFSICFCMSRAQSAPAQSAASVQTRILTPQEIGKVMPQTVFFRGQTAAVQLRNTFGLRFPDGSLMLAGLVDSSGYSSGIKGKYQGYILTETVITVNGKTLPAGAYGFGFLPNDVFLVMDIGAHEVLKVTDQTDAKLLRPRPLSILSGQDGDSYRLYEGRRFVLIGK